MSKRKSNKKVKQMICSCCKGKWSDFELVRAYWSGTSWRGSELQICGNWSGRGFSRFYVNHDRKISLTANQLKGK